MDAVEMAVADTLFWAFHKKFRGEIEKMAQTQGNSDWEDVCQLFWTRVTEAVRSGDGGLFDNVSRSVRQQSLSNRKYFITVLRSCWVDFLRVEEGRPRPGQNMFEELAACLRGRNREQILEIGKAAWEKLLEGSEPGPVKWYIYYRFRKKLSLSEDEADSVVDVVSKHLAVASPAFEPLGDDVADSTDVAEEVDKKRRRLAAGCALVCLMDLVTTVVERGRKCWEAAANPDLGGIRYEEICRDREGSREECPQNDTSRPCCSAGGLVLHPFHLALLQEVLNTGGYPNVSEVHRQFGRGIQSPAYEWHLLLGCVRRLSERYLSSRRR